MLRTQLSLSHSLTLSRYLLNVSRSTAKGAILSTICTKASFYDMGSEKERERLALKDSSRSRDLGSYQLLLVLSVAVHT